LQDSRRQIRQYRYRRKEGLGNPRDRCPIGVPLPAVQYRRYSCLKRRTANRFTNTGMNPDLIFTNQEFLEAPQSKAGTEPLVVASGDFNGDGKVDL